RGPAEARATAPSTRSARRAPTAGKIRGAWGRVRRTPPPPRRATEAPRAATPAPARRSAARSAARPAAAPPRGHRGSPGCAPHHPRTPAPSSRRGCSATPPGPPRSRCPPARSWAARAPPRAPPRRAPRARPPRGAAPRTRLPAGRRAPAGPRRGPPPTKELDHRVRRRNARPRRVTVLVRERAGAARRQHQEGEAELRLAGQGAAAVGAQQRLDLVRRTVCAAHDEDPLAGGLTAQPPRLEIVEAQPRGGGEAAGRRGPQRVHAGVTGEQHAAAGLDVHAEQRAVARHPGQVEVRARVARGHWRGALQVEAARAEGTVFGEE
ncbi:hypothetical protein DAPPUDRAFT_125227, partial [Daphnia pulex]